MRRIRSKYHIAPIGEVYGYWKVLGYSHYKNEHYWLVKCIRCNSEHIRRASQLNLGRSSSCRTCASSMRESNKSPFWKGYENMSGQYLNKLKFRSRDIPISITLKDLWNKWIEQDGKCAYSGVKLSLVSKDTKWSESTASLDRINSDKGYEVGNIQWVLKEVNQMKMDLKEERFKELCNLITSHGTCGI